MSVHLQLEIRRLQQLILGLSGRVEEMVSDAVRALEGKDKILARQVVARDDEVDGAEVEIEEECLKALALYQPVAADLRFIVTVLKINNDLERVADLAANVAERAESLAALPPPELSFDFHDMALRVRKMLNRSLDALIRRDAEMARIVMAADDRVDAMHAGIYRLVASAVAAHPEHTIGYLQLLSISRNLERIADHATNIAEDVIYMLEGEIVRHQDLPKASRPEA
jgi:phosphate transport system protein